MLSKFKVSPLLKRRYQSMTHCYFTALYKPTLSLTNNSGMMVKKKLWAEKHCALTLPKPAPKGDVSISIGLSIRLFLKSLGENLYHCHAVFPGSLIRPGCMWRSGDPDQMRLMGKLDFVPMIPVEENRKTTGSRALLSPSNTTLFLQQE